MAPPATATMTAEAAGGGLRMAFAGRLEATAVARLWRQALQRAAGADRLVLDLSRLQGLDTAGAVLLLRLEQQARSSERQGLAEGAASAVLQRTAEALAITTPRPPAALPPLAAIGRRAIGALRQAMVNIAFLGEAVVAAIAGFRHLHRVRGSEALRHMDEAGTRAIPLTAMLGLLIGVILAFQSHGPMRQFGAEILIPNMVGISLLRELGALMAAVILSGRTGSAFAAEIGTMTVNEEVDALRVMGIDPVSWLVLPRLLAAMLVTPVLALVLALAGIVGMALVMLALGFPIPVVTAQLQHALALSDLWGGTLKAAVFGLAIGYIGCRAGLTAGRGPRAVGDAATQAVVGGIVATVVIDGIFALLFFRFGL